ncbi:S1 family peptidase [Pseudonocardia sp. KRD291]|uniref:S1 family peptidase n=1 Tax=Pseudonocardia sp. KRD291 TaxID=2792007 RepID=UPI001C4A561D|nr:S1 family peptidase [Pseudonocardia sp. KRD291]MBW0107009.1 trypsin-like serine protease [Pseudonocardia sp. KRD291]
MDLRRPHRPRRTALALLAGALAVAGTVAGVAPAVAAPALPLDGLSEAAASALVPAVTATAGEALAGVWFESPGTSGTSASGDAPLGRLMVGTWEPALAPALSALGATPVVRNEPRRDPSAARQALTERTATGMPASLAGFGVDERTQQLVVSEVDGAPDSPVTALLAGLDPAAVRIEKVPAAPRRQASIGGGDTISDGAKRCTAGFAATDGSTGWLLTAGHCTRGSSTWYSGADQNTVGTGARSAEGSTDVGAIPVTGDWTLTPTVGGTTVTGSRSAPVGASVCLTGSTSGRSCGPVDRKDVTVNFDGQQQSGLTAVSTCAQEGDSGGPYITSDGQAQGVHTGAGGDGCTSYFTPIGTALSAMGLSLRTG